MVNAVDFLARYGQGRFMLRPYPLDLRERLLAARAAGLPVAKIEDKFQISRRTVNRWAER